MRKAFLSIVILLISNLLNAQYVDITKDPYLFLSKYESGKDHFFNKLIVTEYFVEYKGSAKNDTVRNEYVYDSVGNILEIASLYNSELKLYRTRIFNKYNSKGYLVDSKGENHISMYGYWFSPYSFENNDKLSSEKNTFYEGRIIASNKTYESKYKEKWIYFYNSTFTDHLNHLYILNDIKSYPDLKLEWLGYLFSSINVYDIKRKQIRKCYYEYKVIH